MKKNKKCRFCSTLNPGDAIYCRNCGRPFKTIEPAADDIDRVKRASRKWKKYSHWKRPITGFVLRMMVVFALVAVSGLLFAYISDLIAEACIADPGVRNAWPIVVGAVAAITVFVIGFIFCKKQLPDEDERDSFPGTYDKIEPYCYLGLRHSRKRALYKIFVKDYRMGLVCVTGYGVAIDAKYALMKWKRKQRVLTVWLNGDTFDIDIYGNFL